MKLLFALFIFAITLTTSAAEVSVPAYDIKLHNLADVDPSTVTAEATINCYHFVGLFSSRRLCNQLFVWPPSDQISVKLEKLSDDSFRLPKSVLNLDNPKHAKHINIKVCFATGDGKSSCVSTSIKDAKKNLANVTLFRPKPFRLEPKVDDLPLETWITRTGLSVGSLDIGLSIRQYHYDTYTQWLNNTIERKGNGYNVFFWSYVALKGVPSDLKMKFEMNLLNFANSYLELKNGSLALTADPQKTLKFNISTKNFSRNLPKSWFAKVRFTSDQYEMTFDFDTRCDSNGRLSGSVSTGLGEVAIVGSCAKLPYTIEAYKLPIKVNGEVIPMDLRFKLKHILGKSLGLDVYDDATGAQIGVSTWSGRY